MKKKNNKKEWKDKEIYFVKMMLINTLEKKTCQQRYHKIIKKRVFLSILGP